MMISSMVFLLMVVTSTTSLVCYQCNSDTNSTCAKDWNSTEEDMHKEWEVTCTKESMVCTKKIGLFTKPRGNPQDIFSDLLDNGSFKYTRFCDDIRFKGCNSDKVSHVWKLQL